MKKILKFLVTSLLLLFGLFIIYVIMAALAEKEPNSEPKKNNQKKLPKKIPTKKSRIKTPYGVFSS